MLREERALRKFLFNCYLPSELGKREIGKRIRALIEAIREDCAKVAADLVLKTPVHGKDKLPMDTRCRIHDRIISAIRGRTPSAGGRG